MRAPLLALAIALAGISAALAQSVDDLLSQVGHYCPDQTARYYELTYEEYGCSFDALGIIRYSQCQEEVDAINRKVMKYNDWLRQCEETSRQAHSDQSAPFTYAPGTLPPGPSPATPTVAPPPPVDPLDAMLTEAEKGASNYQAKNAANLSQMKSDMARQTGGPEVTHEELDAQMASQEAKAEEQGRQYAAEQAAAARQKAADAYLAAIDNYNARLAAQRRLEENQRLAEYNDWVRQQKRASTMRVLTGLIGVFTSVLASQSGSGGGSGGGAAGRSGGEGGGWDCDGNPGSCAAY